MDVGSPFRPAVVNPSRVELVGGWESVLDAQTKTITLQLHQPFTLEFNARAAGPGSYFTHITSSHGCFKYSNKSLTCRVLFGKKVTDAENLCRLR